MTDSAGSARAWPGSDSVPLDTAAVVDSVAASAAALERRSCNPGAVVVPVVLVALAVVVVVVSSDFAVKRDVPDVRLEAQIDRPFEAVEVD